ncbi:uncharacterized protein BDCG_00788 [Blastomyces dermatitidis ER-3]|uniref:Coiled-coil domain-containing protein n=3 Tax=Blastomyces TaxID=229219 RepID=A0A179UVL7_BLAGS|nr:uncharacterized protein BDBG_06272 [Blastomyces gilchristii SLH14081]XP_045272060.1 uncharacterized protein BDCG_00788 [Blastomyces dermatitidis ER-3]EEQ83983.1 hypothetical protein BDCG_00788 [Blastomyces dermatitidis ER-3]EGE83395.1 hypothetical protein BDDG_06339 [Blastomyces dermatitidis ATCC 18188]OAT10432.1 hypothetical protein BDBG_06272 [Blastomyces gilchristii SLH14081]
MPTDSQSLYGIRRPKSTASQKDLTSSSTLAFTTHLSALISKESNPSTSSSATQPTKGRPRPSRSKPDIFTIHNKNAHKRAAADVSGDSPHVIHQVHKRGADIGNIDDATLQRSKRRLAEKAKLYEDLKKGEHLVDSSDEEEDQTALRNPAVHATRRAESNSLVDFDRKWAEEEAIRARRARGSASPSGSDRDADNDDREKEDVLLVDYVDEFGRSRRGTRAEAAEAALQRRSAPLPRTAADEDGGGLDSDITHPTNYNILPSAKPKRPTNLIYGSTVQSAAFNPDANIAARMEHIAKKRDRTPTPPPETHYDAAAEVRTRGTGFYAFSKDQAARKEEMEELLKARKETLGERDAATKKESAREKAKDERRRKIEELRSKRRAEEFLNGLGDLEGIGGDIGKGER